MKGGILEVLLVNAEGIKHTNLIGKPRYYVILQCGDQTHKSKTSVGKNEKSFWNEKFKFKFSFLEWRKLSYLKLRIMDKEIFSEGGFVGETLVHLGGMLTEGNDKGFIEVQPSLYNVVLEDDTYKGEIKIGFKFTANVEVQKETRVCTELNKQKPGSIYGTLFSFWRIPWLKFFFPYKKTSSMDDQKLF